MQVEIGIGKLRPEAIGIVDLDLTAVPASSHSRARSYRAPGSPSRTAQKNPWACFFSISQRMPPTTHGRADSACGRNARTSQRGCPPLLADRVRTEDAERVAVIAVDYRFNFFTSHESL